MAKTPQNHGKSWAPADEKKLDELIQQNTPTRLIALKLGRTEAAVRSHASDEQKSLKPTNQSPYNRQNKR